MALPRPSRPGSNASGLTTGYVLRIVLEMCLLLYIVLLYRRASTSGSAHSEKQRSLITNRKAASGSRINGLVTADEVAAALGAASGVSSDLRQALQAELQADAFQAQASAKELSEKLSRVRYKAAAAVGAQSTNPELLSFLGVLQQQLSALDAATHDTLAQSPSTRITTCGQGIDGSDVALYSMQAAGVPCRSAPHTEYWGEPVVWGGDHRAASAAECCAACWAYRHAAQRGGLEHGHNSTLCNVWVFCGDKEKCGQQYGECWLKVLKDAPVPPAVPGGRSDPNVQWTSGIIYPPEVEDTAQTRPLSGDGNAAPGSLTLHTKLGDIAVQLRPDLAPGSVRELRRMARMIAMRGSACNGCHFYRAEKDFLLQGVIRDPGAYVAMPRHPNPPQQKMMERGLVCWAGGAGGPDFFINVIDDSGFGDSHLCWGKITDMTLIDSIMLKPLKPKAKPNDMTFLQDFVYFNMTLV